MKGILFKEEMFRATVEGKKIQTRRTGGLNWVNENPDECKFLGLEENPDIIDPNDDEFKPLKWKGLCSHFFIPNSEYEYYYFKSRYQPSEVIYLKEPFYAADDGDIYYKYDFPNNSIPVNFQDYDNPKWQNKLFMPEKYARYFIGIKDIRVERLQDISEEDAKAEGVEKDRLIGFGSLNKKSYREGFFLKWIEINKKNSLNKNPFVYVYEYELINLKSKSYEI